MQAGYTAYRLGQFLASMLPAPAARAFARGCGALVSWVSDDLPAVRSNLRAALGPSGSEAKVRRKSRRLIRNYSRYLTDLFRSSRDADGFAPVGRAEGMERLRAAVAGGRGAVVVSGHVGHWEMGAMAMARAGFPVSVIALKHRDPRVDALFTARRKRWSVRTIPIGRAREALRALERREVLALNGDRAYGGPTVTVELFGRPVRLPSGYARLALRAGAPVLPAFFTLEGDTYALRVEEPLDPSGGEEGIVRRFAERFEREVRRVPDQWYVFQRFEEEPRWPV